MYTERHPTTAKFTEWVRDSWQKAAISKLDFRVHGLHHLGDLTISPAELAYGSHSTHGDNFFARYAVPEEYRPYLRFPAAEDHFYSRTPESLLLRLLAIASLRPFPMSRDQNNARAGIKRALELVKKGCSIVIAPEGTRKHPPLSENELQQGAALIAMKAKIPIIPMIIQGARDILPPGSSMPNFTVGGEKRVVQVTFCRPILPKEYEGSLSSRRVNITHDIREGLLGRR